MIGGALGLLVFIIAAVLLIKNNLNTTKNPKPTTPEEKRKRTERNVALGVVALGALAAGNAALERANQKGMQGYGDLVQPKEQRRYIG